MGVPDFQFQRNVSTHTLGEHDGLEINVQDALVIHLFGDDLFVVVIVRRGSRELIVIATSESPAHRNRH